MLQGKQTKYFHCQLFLYYIIYLQKQKKNRKARLLPDVRFSVHFITTQILHLSLLELCFYFPSLQVVHMINCIGFLSKVKGSCPFPKLRGFRTQTGCDSYSLVTGLSSASCNSLAFKISTFSSLKEEN